MLKYFPYLLIIILSLAVFAYYRDIEEKYGEVMLYLADRDQIIENMEFPDYSDRTVTLDIPDSMSFAGEPVPLDIPDVRERLDREIHINRYWHNNSIFLIKRANRWLPQIEEVLKKNGIPEDFKYLPAIEGGLQNVISPKKAVGFWQILKGTGKEYGMEVTSEVDERYDPIKSTEVACKYLNKAYEKFGNWTLVAASFNRGMRGMERALESQKVDNYYDLLLNEETSRYVFRILACKDLLENPEKYNFEIKPEHLYYQEEMDTLVVSKTIPDLAVFARENGINYKILKEHNPWLRDRELNVSGGKSYIFKVPREQPLAD